jgi:predicted transcriptional regulator
MKKDFPVYRAVTEIDQLATSQEANKMYSKIWHDSKVTGGELAERMGISRSYFSDLVSCRRDWNEKLCNKFMDAIRKGNGQ